MALVIYGEKCLPPGFSYIRSEAALTGTEQDRKKIMIIDNPSKVTGNCQLYAVIISAADIQKGKPNDNSDRVSYQILERAVRDIKDYQMDALITSPVSKAAIRKSDPSFIGHTEYLAAKFNTAVFVMNFVSSDLDVALLTTHTSLKKVSDQIKEELIIPKMRMIYQFTRQRYKEGKVALLALNPHCGEDGAFGREEEILNSALEKLAKEGIIIDGPYPADSFFRYKLPEYRQIIACYHDQGLIPFKMLAKGSGVNVTLGLPFFRASVDHGTAYDIAGKGIASPKSMNSALTLTLQII